jgi:NADH-quinone oxidoreductase subunit N
MKVLIALTGLSILAMISEIFRFKKALLPLILIGLAAAFALNLSDWDTGIRHFNDMMYFDNYAVAFSGLVVAVGFLWFLHSEYYFRDKDDTVSDKYALILFSMIGAVVLSSFSHMVMLFLGIEILSIPMYILAGSRKTDIASNEAAMKYFLMGAFATGFLLFGITLIYGVTGSFHLQGITQYLSASPFVDSIFYIGLAMMIIGLAFKVSAAPFHFWTPDVYQGAPTVFTTYMATVVKTAAFAAFLRLLAYTFAPLSEQLNTALAVLSGVTILIGNLSAVYQSSVKRMLAYSSVAHAGYMLLALVAMNTMSSSSVLLYAAAYSVSTLAAFSVLFLIIQATGNDTVESFSGLARSNPFMAFITVTAMLSLAGIPPLAGFFAKYYIFSAALQEGYLALVLIAVLGSLIGVYYYFRIIIAMFKAEESTESIRISLPFRAVLLVTAILSVFLGIFPNALTKLL